MLVHRRSSGFTLLELLAVITLMSLAVGITVLRMDGFTDQSRLQSAASQLASLVRLAQAQARTSGVPRLIEYKIDADRLGMHIPRHANDGWQWDDGVEYLLGTGVSIRGVVLEGKDTTANASQHRAVRIGPDGRFRSHAVMLELHGSHAVSLFRPFGEPGYYLLPEAPQTASWDLLMLELRHAHRAG